MAQSSDLQIVHAPHQLLKDCLRNGDASGIQDRHGMLLTLQFGII